jgi:hypothetical protein
MKYNASQSQPNDIRSFCNSVTPQDVTKHLKVQRESRMRLDKIYAFQTFPIIFSGLLSTAFYGEGKGHTFNIVASILAEEWAEGLACTI